MYSGAWELGITLMLLVSWAAGEFSGKAPDGWKEEELQWRAKHVAELQKPDGWLALSGLEWLESGDNSFGSAADNKMYIAGAGVPAHLGVLEMKDGTVTLREPQGGFPQNFMVAGEPASARELHVEADNDKNAVHLTVGTVNMYVIRRAEKFALRVKDAESPALVGFHGVKWYEPDAKYRVEAKWIPYNPMHSVTLLTLTGTSSSAPVPGVAEFTLGGEKFRLEPVQEESRPEQLFFILRDATSTSTTYGACRFLYSGMPSRGVSQEGELTLDFNRLENPPCAYTPFATCPLPPPGNRLPIGLPAGELRYHE